MTFKVVSVFFGAISRYHSNPRPKAWDFPFYRGYKNTTISIEMVFFIADFFVCFAKNFVYFAVKLSSQLWKPFTSKHL